MKKESSSKLKHNKAIPAVNFSYKGKKMIPKFRAWHITKKIMRDVLAVDFKDKTVRIYIEEDRLNSMSNEPMESCVLMQSTGLVDKNGVEIFDGDILKLSKNKRIAEVFMKPSTSIFMLRIQGDFRKVEMNINGFSFDLSWHVIGNIHQNPELLTNP